MDSLLELDLDSVMAPFEVDLDYYFDNYAKEQTHNTSPYLFDDTDEFTDSSPSSSRPSSGYSDQTQYVDAWPLDSPTTHTPSYLDVYPSLNASPISSTSTTPSSPTRPPRPPTDVFTDLALWACTTPAELFTVYELPEPDPDDAEEDILDLFPAPPTQTHSSRRRTYGELGASFPPFIMLVLIEM